MNSTEKTKHLCQNCGNEHWLRPKPEPRNQREAKNVDFICKNCDFRNLRDGTAVVLSASEIDEATKPSTPIFVLAHAIFLLIIALIFSLIFMVKSCRGEEIDLARIAQIESSGNPLAWRKADDSRGLFQITPICLKEYNNFHPDNQHTPDDLWAPEISRKIADWYFNTRIVQMLKHYGKPVTIENQIIAYNAGISYVVKAKPLPTVTKSYLKKYFAGAK